MSGAMRPMLDTCVFLGVGGDHPRVELLDTATRQTRVLAEYEFRQSVCTIDWRGDRLAIATRKGCIDVARDSAHNARPFETAPKRLRSKGRSGLCCHFTDANELVVTDMNGVHFWQDPFGGGEAVDFPAEGRAVCASASLDRRLYGRAVDGRRFTWGLPDGQLLDRFDGPPPGEKAAFAHMVWWQAADAWAYPAADGALVLWDRRTGDLHELPAHQGVYYFVANYAEDLVTAGYSDGRLKLWDKNGVCRETFALSLPVVAGTMLPGLRPSILLIDDTGRADVYLFTGNDLELEYTLPVNGPYRSVAGLGPREMAEANARIERDEIQRIAETLIKDTGELPVAEVDRLHGELCIHNREGLSQGIRYNKLREQLGDAPRHSVEELVPLSRLAALLDDDPAAMEWLLRYGEMLDTLGQDEAALTVYQRVQRLAPDRDLPRQAGLEAFVAAQRSGAFCIRVLEDPISIEMAIQAAAVLERRVEGAFAIWLSGAIGRRGIAVTPQQVLQEYVALGRANPDADPASCDQIWLLDARGVHREEMLLVRQSAPARPEFHAFLACPAAARAFEAQPLLVLDIQWRADAQHEFTDTAAWNAAVRAAYEEVAAASDFRVWIQNSCEALRHAFFQAENRNSPS